MNVTFYVMNIRHEYMPVKTLDTYASLSASLNASLSASLMWNMSRNMNMNMCQIDVSD